MPGVADFVPRAAERFRLGLVSGARRHEIETVLARAGLRSHFEVILAAEDVPRAKPDPAGYLAARAALARRRPLAARSCVVIEDSLAGVQAAKAAQLPCVGVAHTYSEQELGEAGADAVAASLNDIDEALLGQLYRRLYG